MAAEPLDLNGWLERIQAIHPKSIDMGLERIRAVHQALGSPQPARQVITVAGTNGKGSTVAYLEAIGRANGWSVGAYTSPHLLAFNERIRVNGQVASDAAIVAAFEQIDAARADTPLTYFEFATLAALLIFANADLDLALLEVGLGGRLDATNLIDPDVAVITTVDLDHQDYLGNDRESIGQEKAGIMRPWRPVVLGDRDPPSSVLHRAYALGASAIRFNCDYFVDPGASAGTFQWREPGTVLEIPMPALRAPIQARNAAMAIAAMRALPQEPATAALAQGIAEARLDGRLQHVSVQGRDVYLDVAHNPQAAAVLAEWLAATPVAGRTLAVFAGLQDKDRAGVLSALKGQVDRWWFAPLGGARGQTLSLLREEFAGTPDTEFADDVPSGLQAALSAASGDDRIVVLGSFHTVAEALGVLT